MNKKRKEKSILNEKNNKISYKILQAGLRQNYKFALVMKHVL